MKKIVLLSVACFFLAPALAGHAQETAEQIFGRAISLYESGEHQEALEAFRQAVELKPDYVEARFNLAIALWQQKQFTESRDNFNKVVELAPGSELAAKARQSVAVLEKSGVFDFNPHEQIVTEDPAANIDNLVADLEFGTAGKRLAAARELVFYKDDKAIAALQATVEKTGEQDDIRNAAAVSLAELAVPASLPTYQFILQNQTVFSPDARAAVIRGLAAIKSVEALEQILYAWAGQWPGGITEREIIGLVRELGRPDFANLLAMTYPQATGDRQLYMAMALGLLRDSAGVPVMLARLRADYPEITRSGRPGATDRRPGRRPLPPAEPFGSEILPDEDLLAGQTGQAGGTVVYPEGWTRDMEAELRAEIVTILGLCAGEKQRQFLGYLARSDQSPRVQEAARNAMPILDERIVRSERLYRQAMDEVRENRHTAALPIIEEALRNNPDASYAEEIRNIQLRVNTQRIREILQSQEMLDANREEVISLLQSVVAHNPEAPAAETARNILSQLQAPVGDMGGSPDGMTDGMTEEEFNPAQHVF